MYELEKKVTSASNVQKLLANNMRLTKRKLVGYSNNFLVSVFYFSISPVFSHI